MKERFGTRRTAEYAHPPDVAVDAFEHVVALLEGAAADRAGAHRDDVFRLRHLVVEPHDLGRHLLGHGAGDNHEVRLARRRAEHFGAEAGQVVTRHGRGNHLDGAAGQAKLERPHRVLSAPVVKLREGRRDDTLLAQLASQSLVHHLRNLENRN